MGKDTAGRGKAAVTPVQLAVYLGGAALYALLASGAVILGRRLWRRLAGDWTGKPRLEERRRGRAGATLLFLTLFMVFLALHPFPDPATINCLQGGNRLRLRPFAFLDEMFRLIGSRAGPSAWMRNLTLASAAMNFVLCAAIGLALGRLTGRWGAAVLFGAGLTLGIELTQLTGIWGLYPCPYRYFDVDDLMLNLAGVLAGFALARSPAPSRPDP